MRTACSSCLHPKKENEECPYCQNTTIVSLCEKGHILYEIEDPLTPKGFSLICQVCFIENIKTFS